MVAVTILFVLFAQVGLIVLPLAALLLFGRHNKPRERTALIVSVAVGLWWLLATGEAPEQTIRAAALVGAVFFAMLTVTTSISTTHKGLLAGLAGMLGVTVIFAIGPLSWGEVNWLVEHRIGFVSRVFGAGFWTSGNPLGPVPEATVSAMADVEKMFGAMAKFAGDNFAALVTLEMLTGFALATAIYHRVSENPLGAANGRLRDFRFTEHLGWVAVFGLLGVILPRLVIVKTFAGNFVLVTGVLYALRGFAVMSFAVAAMGGSIFLTVLIVFAIVYMFKLVAAGAIIVGLLDTGLNLRKRWNTPPKIG